MHEWIKYKGKQWLVALSGGADSMALLHMCITHEIDVCVAHVNYQKRESAKRDMEGVISYCAQYNIPCFTHKVETYPTRGNFQSIARTIRYDFFMHLVHAQGLDGVLVAHHMDDVIETYMMQEKRGSTPTHYGIQEGIEMHGISIHRPLLMYTKEELIAYCKRYGVRYFHDESNDSDAYARNRIRHQYIDGMSRGEKLKILTTIDEKNNALQQMRARVEAYTKEYTESIPVSVFTSWDDDVQVEALRTFVMARTTLKGMRKKRIEDIVKALQTKGEGRRTFPVNDRYEVCVEYETIYVQEVHDAQTYAYTYVDKGVDETPYFSLKREGAIMEGLTLSEEDFPIVVRNAQSKDAISLRMGTKRVRRFFIDNKISHKDREIWPVVVNCKGKVIFVCGIGCDIEHFSNIPTMFVVK